MKLNILASYCFCFCFLACDISKEKSDILNNTPKNVILLIGDGTGLSQVSSAFYFKDTIPNYSRFKHVGLIKTSSSRQDITDSAAGATAFASGVKTYNGAVGVADDSTHVKSITELIINDKIQSGIISTSSIVHATPASFYAHALSRSLYEDIAADLVDSNIDFFAGGGTQFFNERKDNLNLLDTLASREFKIDTTKLNSFLEVKSFSKLGYLFGKNHMPPVANGRGDYLQKATQLGINFLNKDNSSFFLMVEGSQIDWGGHNNDSNYLISELIDFDDAIGAALDFAEKDGNTLVIVTADHETGGFTLAATKKINDAGKSYNDYSEIMGVFSTGGHSATLIPVFAFGPRAKSFSGIYENSEIFQKIMEQTQWK